MIPARVSMVPEGPDEPAQVILDRDYLRAREAEERDAADRSSCMVKDVHVEMADLYAQLRCDLDAKPFT